jgi:hypothetical protein
MNKNYKILLNGQEIGATQLEKADVPMGAVYGQIKSTIQTSLGSPLFTNLVLINTNNYSQNI